MTAGGQVTQDELVDPVDLTHAQIARYSRYDSLVIEVDVATAFDAESLRWYRAAYETKQDNRSLSSLSDLEFLAEMGLVAERGTRRLPMLAGVLLLGTKQVLRQQLPRPIVECQYHLTDREAADTGEYWFDSLVLDDNLINTWHSLTHDWHFRFAKRPFRIHPKTMQRDDTPLDYPTVRESMLNLILHQDYSDRFRTGVIRRYRDQTVFWNPGQSFNAAADLLGNGEKAVRNPRIVFALRHIGLGENAGWGLGEVFRNWQKLGNVPPRIVNDRRQDSFELVLQVAPPNAGERPDGTGLVTDQPPAPNGGLVTGGVTNLTERQKTVIDKELAR